MPGDVTEQTQQPQEQAQKKDERISISITKYADPKKRNKYKLSIKGEQTLHKDTKSITDEIEYHLNTTTD